jgi:hypothetical protein
VQNADFGDIQLYNPETRALEIVAQLGFQHDFLDYFKVVRDAGVYCGRAKDLRERIIIEDVETDSEFAPHRHIAGFRAVQSPPLVSRIHDPLGVPSTTLTKTLPRVCNRAQLHRVLLNLLINSTEAMTTVTNRPKLLQVQSMVDESGNVLVPVRDSGIGLGSETVAFSPPSLQQK